MEKVITIDKKEKIEKYDIFDSYLLVNKNFSSFHKYGLSNNSCLELLNQIHKKNKKAYILIDRVYFNDDLKRLSRFINELEENSCDGYYFSDLGVYQLFNNLNLKHKLIYFSQTQIVSAMELESFLSLGIDSVYISKDLPLKSLENYQNNNKVGIVCFSYRNLFYSRRKLLSSYCEEYNLPKYYSKNKYLIREQKRRQKNIIFEDRNGTYIFTDYIENHLNELDKFISLNIKSILFDDNFVEEEIVYKVLDYLNNPNEKYILDSKEKDTYEE